MTNKTEKRKEDHIRICVENDVSSLTSAGFEDVCLVHKSLPEVNFEDISTEVMFFGKKLKAPIIIEAMTGGTKIAEKINKNLAKAAEECGVAIALGSARSAIENKKLWSTYYVRDVAPSIPVIGNLGLVQFVEDYGKEQMLEVVTEMEADAIEIHLNPLQEIVQPEGDVNWKDALNNISGIIREVNFPVIAKETGAGISREVAIMLERAGFSMLDLSGLGGTSFSYVEYFRASSELGKELRDWGIKTTISIVECSRATSLPVIASGGIRSGIDGAKAIALGASYFGMARPLLKAALESAEEVKEIIERYIHELKVAMFLTGASNINDLKDRDVVIAGKVAEWLKARGIKIEEYANRESVKLLKDGLM
jgi:isopentenyl-diphosphate delta-isomerase